MIKLRKVFVTASLVGGLVSLGGGTAFAYNWGSSSSPLMVYQNGASGGTLQGKGYGGVTVNSSSAVLVSYLADMTLDDGRTYANLRATSSTKGTANKESGRRSDGGNTFARMSDQTLSLSNSSIFYAFYVKICQDKSFSGDPCSNEVRAG